MQAQGGIEASRANQFVLLEALKSGRLAIEVEKAALGSLQSASISGIKVPQKHLDYLASKAVANQGDIGANEFLEGLNLQGLDATALLSNNAAIEALFYVSLLSKAGVVKFKETGPELKGFKAADRQAFAASMARLNDPFMAPIKAFISDTGKAMQDARIVRYPAIKEDLAARAASHAEQLDREYAMAQHNIRFTGIIPARDGLESIMAAFQAARQAIKGINDRLAAPTAGIQCISREFMDEQLKLVDPVVHVDSTRLDDLSPRCAGMFKDRPATRFNEGYTALMAIIGSTPDCSQELAASLVLYFIETKQFAVELKEIGNKERKEIRRKINQLVKEELARHLAATWPGDAGAFLAGVDKDEKLSALLPKVLKHALEHEERELMTFTAKNDIEGGEAKLAAAVAAYKGKLQAVAAWCDEMQGLLIGDYATAVNPLKESLEHQNQEIERFRSKLEFFFQETKSQEDKVKIRDDVKRILGEIDVLVNRFEAGMGLVLNKTPLDLEQLGKGLAQFKTQYQGLLNQLNEMLNRFDAFKLLNIVEEIKQFFEKRNEKVNLVANMVLVDLQENVVRITRSMAELSGILKEGKGFSLERGKLGDAAFDEKVAGIASAIDGAMTEEVVEDEFITKKRISLIEERLSELETIKKNLVDKRDKLLFRLVKAEDKGKFLEDRKVGECIICYEPITTLDEEIVVCPHCGRLGHYLCLAYWYEKYSICPVCHGKLTRPEDAVPDFTGGAYSP
ncbi:MAG: E3 ubiquitin protein ligase [Candidatus Lokiarchaeota archaeon]|nr:E3 ubiquitin protein ligase [Candidatus Lokiarchaeota archaeon]